ncbi:MAG: DegT/DnrJ/EryC1/StrS family aminotransferase [Thermoguttaceae bacterium]|nr:DegT/DnrJ/EryC1/StrS family aminotransferase [Thermoguttaceae bacterium]MBR0192685.1 DegT/DnrJ/EryC1/StrS family aminotransferase [Thermoguttaceae bacterium]
MVPFLDLSRHVASLKPAIKEGLASVVDSGIFVLGPEIAQFEKNLAEYCGTRFAVACASGSEALLMALMAIDLKPGDEVIVPSFTFFATASAVVRLGGTPVFADICPDSLNMDPADVERKITSRTRAILPVHLFGRAADMEKLDAIAKAHGLELIEDCAQAIGAEAVLADGQNHRVGSMGSIGCFSFYPTKNLGTMGDGGALTTQNEALAEKLKLLRGHGMQPRYFHKIIGINGRLDAFQGIVLNQKFPFLDGWTAERQQIAERYLDLFKSKPALADKIQLPAQASSGRMVWNQFCICTNERNDLEKFLADRKIGTAIYYPFGLHEQECFRYLNYAPEDLPVTYRVSRSILALPIFPGLTSAEQEEVVEGIAEFYK